MTWAVYLGDTALADVEIYVQGIDEWLGAPSRSFAQRDLLGRHGVLLASDPAVGARTLRIRGTVTPATRTVAARRTAEDSCKALAYAGLIRVSTDDTLTDPRQIEGVAIACDFTPKEHPLVATVSDMVLTVLCPDPTWTDVTARVFQFGGTATPIPTGTAPSGGIIRIVAPASGTVTNPTLTYASSSVVSVKAMTFTTTLNASADYLEVDLDRLTVTKSTAGTPSNGISLLTSGDFFALDPTDAYQPWSSYPTLKVTGSGGSPTATWIGRRRWL
jgi:phage-related protein